MSDQLSKCFVRTFRKPGIVEQDERYRYQYPIILKYLQSKICGKSIVDGFNIAKPGATALYSITDLTGLICDDLISLHSENIINYVCDKNAKAHKRGYKGYTVINPEELVSKYNDGEIEYVVVCNVFREHEIINELVSLGMPLNRIIHLIDIIFWL